MIRYNKKNGNKRFFITVILLVLVIFLSHKNPATSTLPSNVLNVIVSPINSVLYTTSNFIRETYDNVFGTKETKDKIEQLTLENKALQEKLTQLESVVTQQDFLENEYKLLHKNPDNYVQANITSVDSLDSFVHFTVNAGSKDGIKKGDMVVQGVKDSKQSAVDGLIGRVTEVGLNYSKVTSILDQDSNISIFFQNTTSSGVINGRDGEAFFGYTIDQQAPIQIGDEVLTSGIGGVYPRGIYVGKVSEVKLSEDELTTNVTIKSAVDFSKLYRVLILKNDEVKKDNE